MATGRLPDPNTAPVTAKGDLYTYSTVPAKLAVGSNGDTLVADSSASTGLRWQASQAAGKNYIINGGFDIWQRGTSFAAPVNLNYTSDRWWVWSVGSTTQKTVSRQTGFSNSNYCMRVARNSGQTEVNSIGVGTIIESANMYALQGKTVTLSFDARAGANYSASSGNLQVLVQAGTGVDQGVGGWWNPGWTGITQLTGNNVVLTTTATKYSVSFAVPSNIAEMLIGFQFTPTGTAGAADYFEVTNVQLEIGSVATTFTRTGGTLAGELAACQRYYWRQTANTSYTRYGTGIFLNTTDSRISVTNPVPMRVAPTSMDYSTLATYDSAVNAVTSLTLDAAGQLVNALNGVSSGGAQYRPLILLANASTSAYLGFSAEL